MTEVFYESLRKIRHQQEGKTLQPIQKKVPGVFAFVGSNGEPDAPDQYHDEFIVKDEALSVAVHYYVENALLLLDYYKEKNQ